MDTRTRYRMTAIAAAAALTAAGLILTTATAPAHAAAGHRLVYVAALRSNQVTVIDPATETVTGTVPVGSFPDAVAAPRTTITSTPSTREAVTSRSSTPVRARCRAPSRRTGSRRRSRSHRTAPTRM